MKKILIITSLLLLCSTACAENIDIRYDKTNKLGIAFINTMCPKDNVPTQISFCIINNLGLYDKKAYKHISSINSFHKDKTPCTFKCPNFMLRDYLDGTYYSLQENNWHYFPVKSSKTVSFLYDLINYNKKID